MVSLTVKPVNLLDEEKVLKSLFEVYVLGRMNKY